MMKNLPSKTGFLAVAFVALTMFTLFAYFYIRSQPDRPSVDNLSITTVTTAASQKSHRHTETPAITIGTIDSSESSRRSKSSILELMRTTTDYMAVYSRLSLLDDVDAKFYRALILDNCRRESKFKIPSVSNLPVRLKGDLDIMRRAQYLEFLKLREPRNLCRHFLGQNISDETIQREHEQTASLGDLRAQSKLLENRIVSDSIAFSDVVRISSNVPSDSRFNIFSDVVIGKGLGESDFRLIKVALSSKDPTAILTAGPLLTNAYMESRVQFGTESESIQARIASALWDGVACQYSLGCTINEMNRLKIACVVNSQCDATDYDDFLRRYELTPPEWEQYQRVKKLISNAINSGDWSALSVVSYHGLPIGGLLSRQLRPQRLG